MGARDDREPALRVTLAGLLAGGGSGVSRYTVALSRALDDVAREFPDLRLTLLTTAAGAQSVAPRTMEVVDFNVRIPQANRGPVRVPLEQVLLATRRTDLVHFFDLSGPLLTPRRRFTTTMHDAGVVYGFRRFRHAYKRRLWPWALRRSAAVVAVSQFTKDEALRHYEIPAEKIRVIHSGPGLGGPSDGDPPAETNDPYFLYVGDLSTKKNVAFLVRAFQRAATDGRLVLAGRPADGFDELRAEIDDSSARVDLVQDAGDAELDRLYRGATALLHPSRYEGFGFTPLEAMLRGCPVLASDIPAIREVSGSGAQLLPVDDEQAWSEAIAGIAKDDALRTDLRARGASTAAAYSWTATARRLCELFVAVGAR